LGLVGSALATTESIAKATAKATAQAHSFAAEEKADRKKATGGES